ncbi:DMT family transporter [Rhodobacteraceae bacterium RKSG542]|uniref:DMT family transporter n=1 Tax=Pseudovibrio flavus TaxID=2529854 RepID=UPI0012BC3B6F|nr:DMT family transporter [Pseudovibrio flavus]MTI19221.1 DMT family transporter [Pseudovibrio flavus]
MPTSSLRHYKPLRPLVRAGYHTARSWRRLPGNVRGILWALLGTVLFAIMGALVKLLGERLHVTQILVFRQLFMLVISLPVIIRGLPGSLRTKAPMLHAARVVLATGAMVMGFSAVIELPLADSTVIGFSRTFFLTVFAIFFLGEVVGVHRWAATILGFIGVLIIVQPGGGSEFNIYTVIALAGAACAAIVGIILRKVSQLDPPITILTFQAAFVGLLLTPFAIYYWTPMSQGDWIILAALGAVSWMAQMCNIQAMKAGEATVVAPMDYTRIVYASIISVVVFGVWPEWTTYVGASIIIGASLYTMHRESKRKLERKNTIGEGA